VSCMLSCSARAKAAYVVSSGSLRKNCLRLTRNSFIGTVFGLREIRMKSWETGNSTLQTEVRIDPGEFDDYVLYDHSRIDLTVPMKEFRVSLRQFFLKLPELTT
jgi:hypothetical protein